jgi:hypothetical protein
VVEAFLTANVEALELIKSDPETAKQDVNNALQALTGSPLDENILDSAWSQVEFTADPLKSTLVMAWMIVILVIGLVADTIFTSMSRTLRRRRGLAIDD